MPRLTLLRAEPARGGARRGPALAAGALAMAALIGSSTLAFARPAPESFADLAEQVAPAVVNIAVVSETAPGMTMEQGQRPELPFGPDHPLNEFFKRFFGDQMPRGDERGMPQSPGGQRAMGVGSGFIIDPEGYVVTNHHVAGDAKEITVTLASGASYDATLIGSDDKTDLALLKIEADEPLPHVGFGDSDKMRPGDWVMTVGNPFGLGGTVTAGIVSARGRALPGGTLIDFLQLDAPINRGNSGGPAFDTEGEVIGVNTAIYSPNGGSIGIGFAIPSNLAEQVIADLRDDGEVERGWLGVRIQQVTPEIAEGFGIETPRGALVASVEPGSPADKAGLKAGDVILGWGGQEVAEMNDLPRLVAFTPIDEQREVTLWRDGRETTVAVTTGALRPEQQVSSREPEQDRGSVSPSRGTELADSGVVVADLTPELRRRYELEQSEGGVVIVGIAPGSPAAEQGLQVGDVITSIALEPVKSASEAKAKVEARREQGQSVVAVKASRRGVDSFFALPLST